jgi:phosphatidylserine/phosphatidylglycerophosphate/cardiolipin synthase-like enzyme/uncharacterized membrane protein YdjX (TVP38/TMEM64 family)
VAQARRLAYLIDGQSYFSSFRRAAIKARRSLFILGWDIHSEFKLEREDVTDGFPARLGPFLDTLAREREALEIFVLTWDYSMILAPDREWTSRYRLGWQTHDCVHFAFDDCIPAGGSHHQKVVVIDDEIAFVGGLDFTRGRWDTPQHRPGDPLRSDFDGDDPKPYHDVQVMVTGEIAATLGDLARQRWAWATNEEPSPAEEDPDGAGSDSGDRYWPEGVEAELEEAPVAVTRTLPEFGRREAVRETEQLLVDAIAAARQRIFIENQYFTAPRISDALAQRLQEEDGPEVVLVLPRETVGWMSQYTMDVLRERRLGELREADRHDRLRVWYPDLPGLDEQCINVHSKVLVIDEDLVFAGSANLNNRSLGLDSECGLAVESGGEQARRAGIARLRDRLLAEHLDVSVERVEQAIAEAGSLITAIESLQGTDRTLRALETRVPKAVDASVPETSIADPEQPIDVDYIARQLMPEDDKPSARRGLAGLVALILLAVLLAAAWRWTPLSEWVDPDAVLKRISDLRGSWVAPFAVAAIYIVGGFLMFPVTVLIVATGLAFGAVYGFSYALLGAELSALAAYAAGHYLGHDAMRRLSDQWVSRASRFLGRQGLLAVITLRIVPVAPFTVVNLVAGASHIRFRDFALGTLLGLIPGTLALAVLSDRVLAAVRSPDLATVAVLGAVLALVALGSWMLRRWAGGQQAAQD